MDNDYNKKLTGVIIHGFAVAHAAAAALLSQTLVGDEAALTALTIAMICSIAKVNGRSWGNGEALALIGTMIGGYLGVRGAVFLIKWVPVVGNAANAITTFGVTEILGWITYILVKDDKKPGDITKEDIDVLKKQAQKLKDEEKGKGKKLYDGMSYEDKEKYNNIMEQLKDKNVPERTREFLTDSLNEIIKKYI